jgi:hypothetical protein
MVKDNGNYRAINGLEILSSQFHTRLLWSSRRSVYHSFASWIWPLNGEQHEDSFPNVPTAARAAYARILFLTTTSRDVFFQFPMLVMALEITGQFLTKHYRSDFDQTRRQVQILP